MLQKVLQFYLLQQLVAAGPVQLAFIKMELLKFVRDLATTQLCD
jgi:hypothetical protein